MRRLGYALYSVDHYGYVNARKVIHCDRIIRICVKGIVHIRRKRRVCNDRYQLLQKIRGNFLQSFYNLRHILVFCSNLLPRGKMISIFHINCERISKIYSPICSRKLKNFHVGIIDAMHGKTLTVICGNRVLSI